MLRTFSIAALAALSLTACEQPQQDTETTAVSAEPTLATTGLDTDQQKLSYGVGLNIGKSLANQPGPKIDVDILVTGLRDAYTGTEPKVSEEEMQAAIGRIQQQELERLQNLATANLEAGQAFLAENGKQEGVTETETGIQYQVLSSGEGASPTAEDVVRVNYHGTLVDGSVFDSTQERGPAQFPLNRVIPGWTEVLQLMKVGDKWKVFIPAEMGYGEQSPSPDIPPNSVLVFDIELLEIVKS